MLCSQFRPVVGGAERQAETLARALLRQGHEVEVLTPRHERSWPEHEVVEGLPIHRFKMTNLTRSVRGVRGLGVPNLWIERGQIRRAVRRMLPGFDVLHTHLASPVVAFALAPAHALGVPVLCKIACGGNGFDFRALRAGSLLGRRLERVLVEGVDRWIAISREVHRDLVAAGVSEHRIARIPNGIATSAAVRSRAQCPSRRFLCMGRLHKFDFASLFRAFEELLTEVPDLELRIAGPGDTDAVSNRLAEFPKLRHRATVVGFSPAAHELAWADALVHPSRAEGMSNALLEATAAGLPCAASDIPPNREVLADGQAGLLFPLGDRKALLDVLRVLSTDGDVGPRLIEAGRNQIRTRYEIGVVAQQYRALYQELCG